MSFKTPKGTEIKIVQIKGKDYMQVAQRLLWFREDHPDWAIETTALHTGPDESFFRAEIKDDKGRIIATGHKRESKANFSDHHEKSETGAIGRALAHCGYGTQFAPELEEGERVVDSPQDFQGQMHKAMLSAYGLPAEESEDLPAFDEIPEEPVVDFGVNKGKLFSEVIKNKGYMIWLRDTVLNSNSKSKTSPGMKKLFDYAKQKGVI